MIVYDETNPFSSSFKKHTFMDYEIKVLIEYRKAMLQPSVSGLSFVILLYNLNRVLTSPTRCFSERLCRSACFYKFCACFYKYCHLLLWSCVYLLFFHPSAAGLLTAGCFKISVNRENSFFDKIIKGIVILSNCPDAFSSITSQHLLNRYGMLSLNQWLGKTSLLKKKTVKKYYFLSSIQHYNYNNVKYITIHN